MGTTCTNYIVLYDADGMYQIYLHLAYETVPNHFAYGTYVGRVRTLATQMTPATALLSMFTSWWFLHFGMVR